MFYIYFPVYNCQNTAGREEHKASEKKVDFFMKMYIFFLK